MNALEIEAVREAERNLETSGRRYQRLDTIFPLDGQLWALQRIGFCIKTLSFFK
jgi:hypothetical protein